MTIDGTRDRVVVECCAFRKSEVETKAAAVQERNFMALARKEDTKSERIIIARHCDKTKVRTRAC